jgi:hypothetical protein
MIIKTKLQPALATLALGALLAVSDPAISLAAAKNGTPSVHADASNKLTTHAYHSFAASRRQSDGHITLPSATPEGNRAGWFMDR